MDYVKKQKIAIAVYIAALSIKKSKNRKQIKYKKNEAFGWETGSKKEVHSVDMNALCANFEKLTTKIFCSFMRTCMNERNFNELVELTTPFIKKRRSFSESYSGKSAFRACTLRYLATGDSYKSLSAFFSKWNWLNYF